MSRLTKHEKADFAGYLRQCTDAQVQGVYDKERFYNHRSEFNLARDEANRRGLTLDLTSYKEYRNEVSHD